MPTRLYYVLWEILSLAATIYEILRQLYYCISAIIQWSYDLCLRRASLSTLTSTSQRDRLLLQQCRQDVTKLPQHLSLIVGPEEAHVGEKLIERILNYSLIVGIDCVSLYDTRSPAQGRTSLEKLQRRSGGVVEHCKDRQDQHFRWSLPATESIVRNGKRKAATNGYASNGNACGNHVNDSIEVIEVNDRDGRALIAAVCRDLFERRHSKDVQALLGERQRLTEYLDAKLSAHLGGAPNPELCIIFNRQTCTYGMLPWQTRFTEFQTHSSGGREFRVETFAQMLYRYARCEQRWGK